MPLQGTAHSSCVNPVTTRRYVWHRSSLKYLKTTTITRAVCERSVTLPQETDWLAVEKQFQQTWRHGTTCPEVRAVYKIINTTASLKSYEQYLYVFLALVSGFASRFTETPDSSDSIEAQRDFASQNKPRGNENRRWHGTRRKCNIGDKGITSFCTDTNCSLCCIIKSSFDLSFFKGATGWGRFGAGIYTSSTSSKFVSVPQNELLPDMRLTLQLWRLGRTTIRTTSPFLIGRLCC